MKKNKRYILIISLVATSILLAIILIPVASKPTGCTSSSRYSIILGQLNDYSSKKEHIPNINEGYCGMNGEYRLYVL